MDNVSEWQHPFVDVFKKYNSFDAPKSYKGNVTIIHVNNCHIGRIPSLLAKPSKSLDLSCQITQSQSQILTLKLNSATSSADMYSHIHSDIHLIPSST